jgi:hypothetical protein
VNAELEEAAAFLEELRDYRVEFTASGNMTYNAKPGRHDDMVAGAAVAAWRLSDGEVGWGPPSEYLARIALGMGATGLRPTPWAVGLDLGKVSDPAAFVVMRRVSVEAPEFSDLDPLPLQKMSEVPDVEVPPAVPLGTGASIEDERQRFADMLDGRRPTAQEIAEFEARLLGIQRARGNKTDALLRREAKERALTPLHPDMKFDPNVAEWITGPKIKVTYAKGSVESYEQKENARRMPC